MNAHRVPTDIASLTKLPPSSTTPSSTGAGKYTLLRRVQVDGDEISQTDSSLIVVSEDATKNHLPRTSLTKVTLAGVSILTTVRSRLGRS